ncbi:glycerate kinase type-2 family protein [Gracilimonas sp. BCB1]|uniref:glycerate kinase type-2 family protein n=1 Tax=Gracilimonas sp. BCB1 TaxID=3152362 RepID=UPI0032D94B33
MSENTDQHRSLLEDVVNNFVDGKFFNADVEGILSSFPVDGNVWILGAGKASFEMARQAENHFGTQIKDGMVIAPESSRDLKQVQVFKGAHPYPDEDSVSASYELWELAKKIPERDTVVFLLSGGASSLFCIPANGIEIDEYQKTYELLLNSGASIDQINIVRKHISETAGGRLGELLFAHRLISVILSDVPGDKPEVIGSGPTVPDPSTFKEAFQVLKHFRLWEDVPHAVRIHLSKGMHDDSPETPKPETSNWKKHKVTVISGAEILAKNVGSYLNNRGFNVKVSDEAYDADVKKISKRMCSDAISILSKKADMKPPAALVYYGECTVDVKGGGKGGRNQELALNAAISIEGQHPISLLSFATDGIDGPTDAAGAIINSETTLKARKKKLEPESYLQKNDSYHFHEQMDTTLKTGTTGNNLMDIQVILVG